MSAVTADVLAFDIGLPEGWYPMPRPSLGPTWADDLSAQLPAEARRDTLRAALRELQQRYDAFADARMRAAALVDFPESGTISAMLVFGLVSLSTVGDIDSLERDLQTPEIADEASPYEVRTWRATVGAGEMLGVYYLLAHNGGESDALLEERVVMTVYPAGAAQVVQIVATANGLVAFPNMAEAIEEIAATTTVELEGAA